MPRQVKVTMITLLHAEIRRLTGKGGKHNQAAALDSMGIKYMIKPNGRPIVGRQTVKNLLDANIANDIMGHESKKLLDEIIRIIKPSEVWQAITPGYRIDVKLGDIAEVMDLKGKVFLIAGRGLTGIIDETWVAVRKYDDRYKAQVAYSNSSGEKYNETKKFQPEQHEDDSDLA